MSEVILIQNEDPPLIVRLLARVTTSVGFVKSLSIMFFLWIYPALAPETPVQHSISAAAFTRRQLHKQSLAEEHRREAAEFQKEHAGQMGIYTGELEAVEAY